MKELYTKPVLKLDEFESVDILTASSEDEGGVDVIVAPGGEL
jgi:hypothetical protein